MNNGYDPVDTSDEIAARAPQLAATISDYLDQIACSLRPSSVVATSQALRAFATFLGQHHPEITAIAEVQRVHIEGYKRWLAKRSGRLDRATNTTLSLRLGALRMFFTRITEWGWADSPSRPLLFHGDLPHRDLPLPKALDDTDAAKFLRAAQTQRRFLIRVVAEVLLRTGLRVSEICALRDDAVATNTTGYWLHVPVGKLRDDRYLPLHPTLVELIGAYRQAHVDEGHPLLLPQENGQPLNRYVITRMLNRIARDARIGHVHPHQLRHTLATQAINRGMSLEAIAALLGHHSLDMTLKYAKIANRTVAEQYFAVAEKVEAFYTQHDGADPVPTVGQDHHRLLGNGHCTRPRQLDCGFENACENCVFFQTTIAFRPTLQAQHDDALNKDQYQRVKLFGRLLTQVDQDAAS